MASPEQIYNFKRLQDNLATAGQPDEAELHAIGAAGFDVVINLGLADAPYALANEQSILESYGLRYEHLPISFETPEVDCFFAFRDLYRSLAERNCFIHCAANKRVSCFMALYRMVELGWSRADAEADLLEIWEPDPTWRAFMDQVVLLTANR
ncbi:MAG: protein tyrosine phosphatase family protein [Candidatus Thiodiazotropha sp.]